MLISVPLIFFPIMMLMNAEGSFPVPRPVCATYIYMVIFSMSIFTTLSS